MTESAPYQPKHKIRIVTAASLFDGHDDRVCMFAATILELFNIFVNED